MNDAWAAVIAGIAAAIGGAGGGWVTARAAVKQALTEGREQQRNWLLDQRLAAYSDLLAAYGAVRARLKALVEAQSDPFIEDDDPPSTELVQAMGELHESRENLATAMQRIDLVGPRSIMQPAVEALTLAVEAAFQARIAYSVNSHTAEERHAWLAASNAFNLAQIAFVDRANEALHSDQM